MQRMIISAGCVLFAVGLALGVDPAPAASPAVSNVVAVAKPPTDSGLAAHCRMGCNILGNKHSGLLEVASGQKCEVQLQGVPGGSIECVSPI